MTIQELEQKIIELQNKYNDLELKYLKLREWSDLNDQYLEETINALTHSVDKLMGLEDDERDYCFVYERTLEDVLDAMREKNGEL